VNRGDVYYAELGATNNGSVINGNRPVVIIQNDIGNRYSPVVIVAPMTTKRKTKHLPTHVLLLKEKAKWLYRDSTILTEQIFTVSKEQISHKMGHLSPEDMARLDIALAASLALPRGAERSVV